MPTQFGALLKSLASKAGIKTDDENLKKLLGFTEAAQFEVADEFSQALEGNLLTVESAAANTTVRNKLIAEALNGADSELDKAIAEFEFDDAFKNEWKGIVKNTNEKVRKLSGGLKTLMTKVKEDAAKGKPEDKNAVAQIEALKGQILTLNKQMEDATVTHQAEVENYKSAALNQRKDFTLQSQLATKKLPNNGMTADVNISLAKLLVEQEMAKNGLIVQFDANNQPMLKQRKDSAEIDYFVDNKAVNYSAFIDGVLAQNKFIQVNDPNPQNGGQGNNQQHQQTPAGTPQNLNVVADTDTQLALLTGATV